MVSGIPTYYFVCFYFIGLKFHLPNYFTGIILIARIYIFFYQIRDFVKTVNY